MPHLRPLVFALACLLAAPALARPALADDPLPRGASLGVKVGPTDGGGALVHEVLPGLTSERLGVRAGDVLVRIDDVAITGPADVVRAAGALDGGDRVSVTLSRDGAQRTVRGRAVPLPLERYDGATVTYGAVPFEGGHLRDLLALPTGHADAPVVVLIPGFTCASIEPPDPAHPYRRLTEELLRRGVGVYRVEKPGVGDSVGGPACDAIDLDTEIAAFRSAYDRLVDTYGVGQDRVFLFGHSLGGMEAPLVAAARPPRGVIAWGAVLRSWHDYHLELLRIQDFVVRGADPVEAAAQAEAVRDVVGRFYLGNTPPAALATDERARAVLEAIGWDGDERLLGRHYRFWHDLDDVPLLAAWRDTRSHVLSLYGESDFAALDDEDHRLIADVVNHYRPGTARFVLVPGAGHGMEQVGGRDAYRETTRRTGEEPTGPFDVAVADLVADWIAEVRASDPIARE